MHVPTICIRVVKIIFCIRHARMGIYIRYSCILRVLHQCTGVVCICVITIHVHVPTMYNLYVRIVIFCILHARMHICSNIRYSWVLKELHQCTGVLCICVITIPKRAFDITGVYQHGDDENRIYWLARKTSTTLLKANL